MTAVLICVAWVAVGGAIGAVAVRSMTPDDWEFATAGTPLTPETGSTLMRVLLAVFWPLWLIQRGWAWLRSALNKESDV